VKRTLRFMIVGGLLIFVTLAPTLSGGRALAAGLDDKAAGELQEAKRLYKSGRYEQAAEIFSHLSAAHPDFPVFARNAGACYYYLQRPEPALSNLRDYLLSQKRITPEDRTEVDGWISEMEKLRDQNAPIPGPASIPTPASTGRLPSGGVQPQGYGMAPATQPNPGAAGYGYGPGYSTGSAPAPLGIPTPGTTQPAIPGQFPNNGIQPQGYASPAGSQSTSLHAGDYGYGQGYPPASGPVQQLSPSQPASPSPYPYQSQSAPAAEVGRDSSRQTQATNSNTPWLVGGLGVAVLVTGGVFTYLSQSAFSDTVKQYSSSKEGSGKTYADLAGVCYGLGAAGVVTAAIMMVMQEHHSSSSMALAPIVRPDAVGAVIHYTY
jgi:hypothetical protein